MSFYSVIQCLFLTVECCQVLFAEQRGINLCFVTLHHSKSANLGRTPHLVCVELVGAPVFVSIWLPVDTAQESIARLEAQLFVPCVVAVMTI